MDDLELIKQKINIVDLISEYIPLKKAGVNFKAPCPFHQEKTPSFMVSPERGIFHCFGCGVGGDIFKFIMLKEGLEFKDALELLANKAGVTLKGSQKKDGKERLWEVNLKSAQFYHYLLTSHKLGKKALEYLKKRGLEEKTIKEFNIGYAPQNWEILTQFLKKRGFTTQEIIDSGMGVVSKSGCYDRFRGRIMFPLVDVQNRVIGFSGRVLDKSEPKYINSPQTTIFDKRRFLFGINLSKGEIKQKDKAILVEGEMDMIMSYQAGVKNIVASKGTALTEEQIELLKRYAKELLLCFDTDLAGDAASRRGIEMADQAGLNMRVIQVKEAKDPAETILNDKKSWEEAVNGAIPIYDYYLQSVEKRFDSKTAAGKRAIFEEILPIWKKINDPMTKDHYVQKLSALLQVKDDLIRKQMDKVSSQPPTVRLQVTDAKPVAPPVSKREEPHNRRRLLEEYLIALMLHIPKDHQFVPNFPETLFTEDILKQIYVLLVLFLDSISFKGLDFKIQEFIKGLPEDLVEKIDTLYLMPTDEKLTDKKIWQQELDTVVKELKKMLIRSSLEKLSLQIKSAQEFEKAEQLEVLNKRFRDLSVKLKNL
jgi:DNA primase